MILPQLLKQKAYAYAARFHAVIQLPLEIICNQKVMPDMKTKP